MARVIIGKALQEEVEKKFRAESKKIFSAMKSLEQIPHKGKALGHVQDIVIKELKYGKFRFYFITDGEPAEGDRGNKRNPEVAWI
jgi:sporulation protein YlmC with PRC-barrel domain